MNFKDIENLKQLSGFLKLDEESLYFYLNKGKTIYDRANPTDKNNSKYNCVERMHIPKKNKSLGFRTVYNIKDEIFQDLNKIIFFYIDKEYSPLDCVQGFVKGRNIATNASLHLAKKRILNIDIKDFFDSIKKKDVIKAFKSFGCKHEIAEALAELTTLEDRLVLGFNTSPIIANCVFEDIDRSFMKLAEDTKSVYSRYADDITFSSDDELPLVQVIKDVLEKYGFDVNEDKTKEMLRGESQYVTGLTVFDDDYPRVSKKMKRKIRLLLYYFKKYGILAHIMHVGKLSINDLVDDVLLSMRLERISIKLAYKTKGWIDFLHSVEPLSAERYYADYDQIKDDMHTKLVIAKVRLKNNASKAGNKKYKSVIE